MNVRLLILVIGVMVTHTTFAQQYNTAIGVRGDWSNLDTDLAELSCKHFFDRNNGLEGNFGFAREYFWLETMYHHNQTLKGNVDWFFGGGADFGYWNTNYDRRYSASERTGFWSGTSAVLGVEYTTSFIPINLSFDFGPTLRVIPEVKMGIKVGFSLRYAFGASR